MQLFVFLGQVQGILSWLETHWFSDPETECARLDQRPAAILDNKQNLQGELRAVLRGLRVARCCAPHFEVP